MHTVNVVGLINPLEKVNYVTLTYGCIPTTGIKLSDNVNCWGGFGSQRNTDCW